MGRIQSCATKRWSLDSAARELSSVLWRAHFLSHNLSQFAWESAHALPSQYLRASTSCVQVTHPTLPSLLCNSSSIAALIRLNALFLRLKRKLPQFRALLLKLPLSLSQVIRLHQQVLSVCQSTDFIRKRVARLLLREWSQVFPTHFFDWFVFRDDFWVSQFVFRNSPSSSKTAWQCLLLPTLPASFGRWPQTNWLLPCCSGKLHWCFQIWHWWFSFESKPNYRRDHFHHRLRSLPLSLPIPQLSLY